MDDFYQESETVEFKRSTAQLENALKAVCAFLNHKGGTVYFGISDKNKVIGQDVSDSTLKMISQKIRQKIKPEVSPGINVLESEGKKIIEVKISKGTNKPYYLGGIAYKRAGTESFVIAPDELEKIILDKKKRHWDSQICNSATLDDIDEKIVRWFLKEAKNKRSLNISVDAPIDEVLMRLKLLNNGKLTNAAVLLFAKVPQNYFIQSEVKCIRFRGTDITGPMVDMKVIESNIIEQVTDAEKFIFNHISLSSWIEDWKMQRQEKWEYSPKAIREALANAIAHRDYSSASKIQVRIFDDRMEFWNPGELQEPLTLPDLKKTHKSIPENPHIARTFFWIKYVEEVGTGTNKMVRWNMDLGLAEPEYEQITGDFVVTFWKSKLTDEYLCSLNLNERQREAMSYLKEHGKITKKEYMSLTKISKTAAFKDISSLLDCKLIRGIGGGRSACYVLQERSQKDRKKTEKRPKKMKRHHIFNSQP